MIIGPQIWSHLTQAMVYSRRLRSRNRSDSTSSEEKEALKNIIYSDGRRYGVYTPVPVQRTLELRSGDDLEENEDEEGSDFEELDDYEETVYRSTTYRPPSEEEEDVLEHEVRRYELKKRAAGAAAYFNEPQKVDGLWQKLIDLKTVKTMLKFLRRLCRFMLRKSFMVVNVLWLLAPLCCFIIAITVPQYLTTAIQYVDILSSKVIGSRASANGSGLEIEAMRSMVQELLDLKLLDMKEEISLLQQTVKAQKRDITALKSLHDTLHRAHDEALQKLGFVEFDSAITVHVESIVAKRTEELWEKFLDTSLQLQQDIRAAATQQEQLSAVVKEQEEKMDAVQDMVKKSVTASKSDAANEYARGREMQKEFTDWHDAFERNMESEVQRKMQAVENRLSRVLQEEKDAFSSSANALRGLDATDPGILRVIEVAVQAIEIKKTGRVDHAALANGASVIHSERDLLYQHKLSPVQLLTQSIGLSDPGDDNQFTSPSFRPAPAPFLGLSLPSGETPWWISRHNGRPETALSETMEMGSCWGIAGSSGRLSVKFARQIVADAVTIDHIPAQIASDFSSAPNEFRILGILGHPLRETVDFIFLGNFSYASIGPASQTFNLISPQSQHSAVDGISLEVLSNHGHSEYTCLYRFRVHGQPV